MIMEMFEIEPSNLNYMKRQKNCTTNISKSTSKVHALFYLHIHQLFLFSFLDDPIRFGPQSLKDRAL